MTNRIKQVRAEIRLTEEVNTDLQKIADIEFNGNRGLAAASAVKEMIKREKRAGGMLCQS